MPSASGGAHAHLLVGTAVLVAAHLLAPWLLRLRQRVDAPARSFVGGMAVAYVFVQLLPELDLAHAEIGTRIHWVILGGFVAIYGIEHLVIVRGERTAPGRAFAVRLAVAAIYDALVVFTLGTQLPDRISLAVVFLATLALHLVSMNHGIQERFGEERRNVTIAVMIAATLAGAGAGALYSERGASLEVDLATATLAGFMMFQVFHDELPSAKAIRFLWFGVGVVVTVLSRALLE